MEEEKILFYSTDEVDEYYESITALSEKMIEAKEELQETAHTLGKVLNADYISVCFHHTSTPNVNSFNVEVKNVKREGCLFDSIIEQFKNMLERKQVLLQEQIDELAL